MNRPCPSGHERCAAVRLGTLRRAAGRWWPFGYAALLGFVAASAWFADSLATLRFGVTVWCATAAGWFGYYRSAQRTVVRLRARGDRGLPCATCHHYACNGAECASCEGDCTAPRVVSMPRPGVPRPRADWLN